MLSKKTQYAFKALTYLAEHREDGPVLIAEISKKKKNTPEVFREYIIAASEGGYFSQQKKGKAEAIILA